jgi:hypothetical protein
MPLTRFERHDENRYDDGRAQKENLPECKTGTDPLDDCIAKRKCEHGKDDRNDCRTSPIGCKSCFSGYHSLRSYPIVLTLVFVFLESYLILYPNVRTWPKIAPRFDAMGVGFGHFSDSEKSNLSVCFVAISVVHCFA